MKEGDGAEHRPGSVSGRADPKGCQHRSTSETGKVLGRVFAEGKTHQEGRRCGKFRGNQGSTANAVKGKVAVTTDTAFRLGLYFGVSPRNWLNLQNAYDLMEFERHSAASIRRQVKPLAPAAA